MLDPDWSPEKGYSHAGNLLAIVERKERENERNSLVESHALHSASPSPCLISSRQANRMRKLGRVILWVLVAWIGINVVLVVLSYFGGML